MTLQIDMNIHTVVRYILDSCVKVVQLIDRERSRGSQ